MVKIMRDGRGGGTYRGRRRGRHETAQEGGAEVAIQVEGETDGGGLGQYRRAKVEVCSRGGNKGRREE